MKGKKIDFGEANCGIARSLQILGDRWTLLIVREAFHGRQRFGEFQKSLGLAKNILSTRLKKLIEDGILEIESVNDSPLTKRYVLTKRENSSASSWSHYGNGAAKIVLKANFQGQ